jgi:cytochrome c553
VKLVLVLAILVVYVALIFGSEVSALIATPTVTQEQGAKKQPDVLKLGQEAKLGQVTFSHTAQPAAEAAKHPPLKTAWPADRTTTLTAETLKDMKEGDVIACRSCHSRQGEVPKNLSAIPEIKHESSAAKITLTNQFAFHRNCASCHDEVMKTRPELKAPKTTQCTMCHKKGA